MSDESKDKNKQNNSEQPSRRKTVRRMLVGGGIITAGSQAPEKWIKPTIDSVLMAAHAQTSPAGAPVAPGGPTASPSAVPSATPSAVPSAVPSASSPPTPGP